MAMLPGSKTDPLEIGITAQQETLGLIQDQVIAQLHVNVCST